MDEVVTFTRIIPATETMFLIPAFPLDGALIDLYFSQGIYYDSGAGGSGQPITNYLSCSRASTAYAKNSDGTLTSLGSNTLRLGVGVGLLIENARTNYQLSSQDLTDTDWNKQQISIGTNTTAPDGTNTGQQVIENAAASVEHRYFAAVTPAPTGGDITWSVFVKNGITNGRRYVGVASIDSGGNRYAIVVDTVAGTITQAGAISGVPVSPTSGIEAFTNGWYRVFIKMNDATGGNDSFLIFGCDSATPTIGAGGEVYNGDGVSNFYVWGHQVETGSFLSSYIPTTTVAVTRAADNITTTGSLQTAINAATASLVTQTDNGGGAGFAANVFDSNGTNLLGFNASNNGLASITATLTTGNTTIRTSQDKLGLAWDGTGRSLVLNGGTVVSDASAQTPSATQHVGSTGAANFIYAYVERLTVWVTKLANTTLQGFTA